MIRIDIPPMRKPVILAMFASSMPLMGCALAQTSADTLIATSARPVHQAAAANAGSLLMQAQALYDAGQHAAVVELLKGVARAPEPVPELDFLLAKSCHRLEQFDAALAGYWNVVRQTLPERGASAPLAARALRGKALLNIASIHQDMAEHAIAQWQAVGIPVREQTRVQERSKSVGAALMRARSQIPAASEDDNTGSLELPASR